MYRTFRNQREVESLVVLVGLSAPLEVGQEAHQKVAASHEWPPLPLAQALGVPCSWLKCFTQDDVGLVAPGPRVWVGNLDARNLTATWTALRKQLEPTKATAKQRRVVRTLR